MDIRRKLSPTWVIPVVVLLFHGAFALDAARRLSPVWDEIVYPAAGYVQWRTGALSLNTEHPFLVKILSAVPLLVLNPSLPSTNTGLGEDAYRYGYQFTFRNRVTAKKLIFFSRLPSVLFSVLTGIVLWLWVRSLWGFGGANLAFFCYAMTPAFLSRASLALLEMPMYFFSSISLWMYDRYRRQIGSWGLVLSGVAAGVALLCKFTAIPLVVGLGLAEIISGRDKMRNRFWNVSKICGAAVLTVVILYLPWSNAGAALKDVIWHLFNIARSDLPYYWNGHKLVGAPSLLTWAAVVLKAPPFLLVLSAIGFSGWMLNRSHSTTLILLLAFGVCIMGLTLFTESAYSTVQISSVYLIVAVFAGGAVSVCRKKSLFWAVGFLCLGALSDVAMAHPNFLAYFTPFVGTKNGHRWLSDSDQDWGQSLPALSSEWKKRGRPPLILAYAGAGDPGAYGIEFQDLLSPSLMIRDHRDNLIPVEASKVLLVVFTKVMQSEDRYFDWLQKNRRPEPMVDPCFFVYDISADDDIYRWMGHVYLATAREKLASWAFRRAQRLKPGNPDDENMIKLVESKL